MKKIIVLLAFFFLSAGIAGAVTDSPYPSINNKQTIESGDNEFTFGVFGDFRPLRRDKPYASAYLRMIDELSMIGPSFVVSLGDAYYGYGGSFQKFRNEVDYFLSTVKPLGVPFYHVIGNHEVTDDPQRDAYIKRLFGKAYGSLDFGGSHFVMLDSEEKGHEGTISGDQLRWLEKDLSTNDKALNIFVFLHRPLFSVIDPGLSRGKSFADKGNRDALHALFVGHKVKAVFAAHEHLFGDITKDGVRYIISGGGGAPLYKSPQDSGFFHYLLVRVQGGDVRIDVISPSALELRTLYNNYGFDPRAEVELANTSNKGIQMNAVPVLMPRAEPSTYRVRAVSISSRGEIKEQSAKINTVRDNGDGSSTLSIGTFLPSNGLLRITVQMSL